MTSFGGIESQHAVVLCCNSIMSRKAHGTSKTPVQKNLRWNCDYETADRICNFNRHGAERSGYWRTTSFVQEAIKEYEEKGEVTFYDSNTGKPLFVAPKGRSMEDFLKESASHGWPSFRDEETVWKNVRCLPNGEAVSVDGTHLGHNLPDFSGSRYCINLVSVAGRPTR
jgi:peptide methionine sulfoxide reductase MsrB